MYFIVLIEDTISNPLCFFFLDEDFIIMTDYSETDETIAPKSSLKPPQYVKFDCFFEFNSELQ